MSNAFLIRGASLPDGGAADILIAEGAIQQVAASGLADLSTAASPFAAEGAAAVGPQVIEAAGLLALPGLVDLHTHLRQPGFEESEDIGTGTYAAAAGGYTAVFAMPNTSPAQDCPEVIRQVQQIAAEKAHCRVTPIGAVTRGIAGEELADLQGMAECGVRVFSDDGNCVHDPALMSQALEITREFGGVIAQHAQEPRLTLAAQANAGAAAAKLGLTGWPATAEEIIIARDILLARAADARLHICHTSLAGSVDVLKWGKELGVKVTAEVTPHHLLLDDDYILGGDPRFKVNPPLRSKRDALALREAVGSGIIDIIATDHAPHRHKGSDWRLAPNGMVGLECALSVVQKTLIDPGIISWQRAVQAMSSLPAEIGGLPQNELIPGRPANLTLYDPQAVRVIDTQDIYGKSSNSPYIGLELPGRVLCTFYEGRMVFSTDRF